MISPVPAFDAIVLADGPQADGWVRGLSLHERARRICARAGARRTHVLRQTDPLPEVDTNAGLLIVSARDQVVHSDLVTPLLAANGARRRAVGPDGEYAGALFATPDAVGELHGLLPADSQVWQGRNDVTSVPHGPVARHRAVTRQERSAAGRYLERIIHKPQDGPVTRYLFRPISIPITRALLHTPITPNQVSAVVALLGIIGVGLALSADYNRVTLGAAIMLVAGYLDGCDGEIARLKLRSSKFGAWLDTITDEASQLLFMIALGYHNYLVYDNELWLASIGVGTATYLVSIFGIYYWLIVVVNSANSQDYVGKTEIATDPDGTRRVVPSPPPPPTRELPPWLRAILEFIPHLVRRDFVNWGTVLFAAVHLNWLSYPIMVIGGVITAIAVVIPNHLRLRSNLRNVRATTG